MDSKSWHCSNNWGKILQSGFKLIPKLIISLLQCLVKTWTIFKKLLRYRKVARSNPVYNSILETFGQRSQYISNAYILGIKFPLHKHLKVLMCATNPDSLLLTTLRYTKNNNLAYSKLAKLAFRVSFIVSTSDQKPNKKTSKSTFLLQFHTLLRFWLKLKL